MAFILHFPLWIGMMLPLFRSDLRSKVYRDGDFTLAIAPRSVQSWAMGTRLFTHLIDMIEAQFWVVSRCEDDKHGYSAPS
ncbi:Uncharacterized protein HZ326_18713 [Fusarium oxysporum f. sp. albedinis]|nr:Uncharacterized protein HZ326_18713 [Fusarium oxysporum f. sp. albedinis]